MRGERKSGSSAASELANSVALCYHGLHGEVRGFLALGWSSSLALPAQLVSESGALLGCSDTTLQRHHLILNNTVDHHRSQLKNYISFYKLYQPVTAQLVEWEWRAGEAQRQVATVGGWLDSASNGSTRNCIFKLYSLHSTEKQLRHHARSSLRITSHL